jgi:hypothetical protein
MTYSKFYSNPRSFPLSLAQGMFELNSGTHLQLKELEADEDRRLRMAIGAPEWQLYTYVNDKRDLNQVRTSFFCLVTRRKRTERHTFLTPVSELF